MHRARCWTTWRRTWTARRRGWPRHRRAAVAPRSWRAAALTARRGTQRKLTQVIKKSGLGGQLAIILFLIMFLVVLLVVTFN